MNLSSQQLPDISRMSLYYFDTCPYCVLVLDALKELKLEMELRHILEHEQYAEELVREGGIDMVPCLKIIHPDGRVQWMYESLDIIAYLKKRVSQYS